MKLCGLLYAMTSIQISFQNDIHASTKFIWFFGNFDLKYDNKLGILIPAWRSLESLATERELKVRDSTVRIQHYIDNLDDTVNNMFDWCRWPKFEIRHWCLLTGLQIPVWFNPAGLCTKTAAIFDWTCIIVNHVHLTNVIFLFIRYESEKHTLIFLVTPAIAKYSQSRSNSILK